MRRSTGRSFFRPAGSTASSLALVAAIACSNAVAQTPAPAPGSLRELFPSSSIDSQARADAALAATAGAKVRVEKEYKTEARDCLSTVLVNACIDKARELRRRRMGEIDAVELDANRFKRRDKADTLEADRAKREAERAANAKADEELRSRNRKAFDEKQAQGVRDAAERTARARSARAAPAKPHQPAIKTGRPTDVAADRVQRQKNAAGQALKVRQAKDHLGEIERRSVAKAADRKRRADEKAAKDAKTAAALPATTARPATP